MTKLIPLPMQATTVLGEVDKFYLLKEDAQKHELARIYLMLEQYITEVDPFKKFNRQSVRLYILKAFSNVHEITELAFIFDEKIDKKQYLCMQFLCQIIDELEKILGEIQGQKLIENKKWLTQLSLEKSKSDEDSHLQELSYFSNQLFEQLENYIGTAITIRIWENTYQKLNKIYGGLEEFPILLQLLPSKMLDDTKLRLLSRMQMEDTLLKQSHNLIAINQQLTRKNEELIHIQKALLHAQMTEKETYNLMSTIMETVGECIVTIDENSQIVMANRETEKTWGYENGELQGKALDILMPPEFRNMHHQGLSNYLKTKKSSVLGKWITVSAQRKDGSIFPIEMKIMETQMGEKRLFTAALHDITYRIKQEEKLKQKNDELDMLIYKTSHDLRGPITSILGLTQIIEANPDEHQIYVKLIEKSIYKLDETIRDLMNFGQLNNPNLAVTEINLHELITEIIDSLRHIKGFEEVKISLNFDKNTNIYSKRNLLKSVFQNLIANSVNYRRKDVDSFIQVKIISEEKKFFISVVDNGQGIDNQFQEKIFNMFFRANSTVSGSGLGLYIVKKSVESLEGTIRLESKVGEGTTFFLTFPLEINA